MLKIFSNFKNNIFIFTGVLMVCFWVSVEVRNQQFDTWEKTPAAYFVGERPMMTTLDAPYWLRWAREYNEGTYGQNNYLRDYPDRSQSLVETSLKELPPTKEYIDLDPSPKPNSNPSSITPNTRYSDLPLLSFLIAHVSKFFSQNYYVTGTLIIPILASLFILPIGYYFFIIGVPLSGLMGGMIGTFASGYYMRSSIGRIDTDMLNLFFPVLIALLILLASRAKNDRAVILFSISAGLCLFLFQWWYNKTGFVSVYFFVLIFILFIKQIRFHTILISALLFLLCVRPENFIDSSNSIQGFLKDYSIFEFENEATIPVKKSESKPASFPNTLTTISEVDRVPMEEVLKRVILNPSIAWAGLLAFFGLSFFRWRDLIPLAPILAIGLMSFLSSNRFIMYLGPFIGFGIGWLLHLGVESIFLFIAKITQSRDLNMDTKTLSHKQNENGTVSLWGHFYYLVSGLHFELAGVSSGKKVKIEKGESKLFHWGGYNINWLNLSRQLVLYSGLGILFWFISGQTAISYIPGPSIHPRLYATFLEIKNRVQENAALLTWWDYGYAITDATGLATFHDGGSQFGPKTYFTARGIISPDQNELYKITQFMATVGTGGILKNNTSPDDLLRAVNNSKHIPLDPIYLFFTADMTGKYGAISKLGSWDIAKGGSKPRVYQNLTCNKITNKEMNCQGAKIDLIAGFINNQLALRRIIFIRNGKAIREHNFDRDKGYTLQLLVADSKIFAVQLIDEAVFLSNYNQMFLLGRYRKDLFEESFNAFPFSRLFRIKY